jgi:hypothetical protein
MNSVFRVYRYPPDYAAFIGKDLTPQGTIECFPAGVSENPSGKETFILYQNVPNPCAGSVTIDFTLFQTEMVTLTIRNSFGNEIRTVLKEIKAPGYYSYSLDIHDLPAGMYFYSMTAGNMVQTKKMIVRS